MSCFKAYDIRGKVPEELNTELAKRIGYAFVEDFNIKNVVIGHDIRLSGPELSLALSQGLREAGANVTDIGICGTEEIYFATFSENFDGGIIITASHNPADYNGMKLVSKDAAPISADSGLFAIRDKVYSSDFNPTPKTVQGTYAQANYRHKYIEHLLTYIDLSKLKPLHLVADPGNGCAGPIVKALAKKLPFKFTFINESPDGTFPNGVPNPILPENRLHTSKKVIAEKANFGIAWDGDFDRCFFFDNNGVFIEGYYLVGLLSQALLAKCPQSKIIHDPRLIWNTIEIVNKSGGISIENKSGHAFIKERMRKENALYGGEMSAHHYFRDFSYCDSGMIPWLLVAYLVCSSNRSLAELVEERVNLFPCSGEINSRVLNAEAATTAVREHFINKAIAEDNIDGLSLDFGNWRFNLRSSNTEPLLRLNVESKADKQLLEKQTKEILKIINQFTE